MLSSRVKVVSYLIVLVFCMAALAACGGGSGVEQGAEDQPDQQQQDDQQAGNDQQAQQPEDDGADDNGVQNDSAGAGGASGNVYQVGDAGEVELAVDNGRLVLIEARPNQGWNVREVEEENDEVELDFVQGNVTWEFEAELENGEIQVETERDTED
jgi:hypothetical protein